MALRKISQPIQKLGYEHLDTLTRTGVWHQDTSAKADPARGYPGLGEAGLLEVFSPDAAMVYQRYTVFRSGGMFWRGWYVGKWYPWVEVATK